MSIRTIKMPDIGEGVAEAEIVEWHVAVGEAIAEDQTIAAIQTDKATVEIPSPVSGTVIALGGTIGAVLAVGADLIRVETEGDASGQTQEPVPAPRVEQPPRTEQTQSPPPTKPLAAAPSGPTPSKPPAAPLSAPQKPLASPAVRRRAQDAGLDLHRIRGTGPAGRIEHADLDAALRGDRAAGVGRMPNDQVDEVKLTGLRRVIARRMAESTRNIAHFSYVEEVDVTALEELREALNADSPPVRLTLLPFLVMALVKAVAAYPAMNALYDDETDTVRRHGAVHIGIATQTEAGLVVPVLRHAEARDLHDCATEIARLAVTARDGTAPRDALSGSTITITSLGALGGIATTPVINRPEVAIVGVNKIAIRPVWRDGGFVPRKIMNLSSSFDHRVIDGYDAAQFVQRIRALLEVPAKLFMET
jgi:2-oxoisovalerate dehydrogenase E2 component (dihydrolipoyl transacylase)